MSHGIYVAMGAARAQEHRLETLANDLANARTAGYKQQEAIYKQIHNDVTALGSPKFKKTTKKRRNRMVP